MNLGGGVSARIPLTLYADSEGTLPHVDGDLPRWLPESHLPSGDDRFTRLADVALAWNVLQHFYPYFDVVDADWSRSLRDALRSAATDPDEQAFLDTLRRLVADLHDGHGRVDLPRISTGSHRLPIAWAWVEDRLVVTHASTDEAGGLKPGDRIREIDGRAIGAGTRGPITEKLQSKYFDVVHGRSAAHTDWLTVV